MLIWIHLVISSTGLLFCSFISIINNKNLFYIQNEFSIEVPQLPVDGIFRPVHKRPKRKTQLRPLDENKPLHDTRTDEEVMAGNSNISFKDSLCFYPSLLQNFQAQR
jgi:hypothetical protein